MSNEVAGLLTRPNPETSTKTCIAMRLLIMFGCLCSYSLQSYKQNIRSWWRHEMEIFSALLALCVGNSPATGEFPAQRSVTRSFDVFFDLRQIKQLSKQSWGWWFGPSSR